MKNGKHKLIEFYLESHPEDAYSVLVKYPAKEIAQLIALFDANKCTAVLNILPVFLLSESMKFLENDKVSSLFHLINSNLVSRVMRKWKEEGEIERFEGVLKQLKPETRAQVMKLLQYSKDSIGSIMNPAPFAIAPDLSIKETLNILGKERNRYSRYIYIVDKEKKLLGVIPFKEVFYSTEKEELISKLMSKDIFSLSPNLKTEAIYTHRVWSKWDSLPVLGTNNDLLGVLRYETIEEAMNEEVIEVKDDSVNSAAEAIADVVKIGVKGAVVLGVDLLSLGRNK